jgi:16S rRNA (guanine966-N2)-methyltransferase
MRVVAGRLRGRRLLVDAGRDTRPTSERARAGLFDWLGSRVLEARVLDLFAGCGALGIEALSRGATSAVFVERARGALGALRRNLEALELEELAVVVASDVQRFLAGAGARHGPFELILADPPYGADWPARLAGSPRTAALLVPGGALVAERSARDPQPEPAPELRLRATKTYGETAFDWFEHEETTR